MHLRVSAAALAVILAPALAAAQNPVATALRHEASESAKNLIAAAEEFPAAKYSYKPTAPQMSVADIVAHLSEGNDYLCSSVGGMKAPTRTKVAASAGKAALVARLKETFAFCDQALAGLDDSKLGEELPFFDGSKVTRARLELATVADWADHYSQFANYLRLNKMLPPTAKKPAM